MRRVCKTTIVLILTFLVLCQVVNCALAEYLVPTNVQVQVDDVNSDSLKDLGFRVTKGTAGVEGVNVSIFTNALSDDALISGLTDNNGSLTFYDLPAGSYFWHASDGGDGNAIISAEEFLLTEEEVVAWQVVQLEWVGESEDGVRQLFGNMSLLTGYSLVEHPFPASQNKSMMDYSREIFQWTQDFERYMAELGHPKLNLFHKMAFPLKSISLGLFNDTVNQVNFTQVTKMTLSLQLDISDNSTNFILSAMYGNGTLATYHDLLKIPPVPVIGKTMASPVWEMLQNVVMTLGAYILTHSVEPDWIDPKVSWELRISSTDRTLNEIVSTIDMIKPSLSIVKDVLPSLQKALEWLANHGWITGVSPETLASIGALATAVNFAFGVLILVRLVCHWAGRYTSIETFLGELMQGNLLLAAEVAVAVIDIALLAYLGYLTFIGASASTGVGLVLAAIGTLVLLLQYRGDHEDAMKDLQGRLGTALTDLFKTRQSLRNIDVTSTRHTAAVSANVGTLMLQFAQIAHQHSSAPYMKQFFTLASQNFVTFGNLETELADAVDPALESVDDLITEYLDWEGSTRSYLSGFIQETSRVKAHLVGYNSTTVSYEYADKYGVGGGPLKRAVIGTRVGTLNEYQKRTVDASNLDGINSFTNVGEVARIDYGPLDPLHWWPYLAGWASDPPSQIDPRGNKAGVLYNVNDTSNPLVFVLPKSPDYSITSSSPSNQTSYDYKFYFDAETTKYDWYNNLLLKGLPNEEVLDEWAQDLSQSSEVTDLWLKRVKRALDNLADFQGIVQEPIDVQPPTTTLFIGEPKKFESGRVFLSTSTPIALFASDNNGSGVASTGYEIHNGTFSTGWNSHLETRLVQLNVFWWNLSVPMPSFSLPNYLTDGEYTIRYNSTDNAGNVETSKNVTVFLEHVYASICFSPETFDMNSGSEFTAHIEIPSCHLTNLDASGISRPSILLNRTIPIDLNAPTAIGDYDKDNVTDLTVSFNRTDLCEYLLNQHTKSGNVTLILEGMLNDNVPFEGEGTISLISSSPTEDVAISYANVSPTKVIRGQQVNINVGVENLGSVSETFNVTIYADGQVIGSQALVGLEAGDELTQSFVWNTTYFLPSHTYNITAFAVISPEIDSNMTNNFLFAGTVEIVSATALGDINQDGIVDIFDLMTAVIAFNSKPTDSSWDARCDLNGDSVIDILDLAIVAINFGKEQTPP